MKKEILTTFGLLAAGLGLLWAISKINVSVNITRADCGCGEVGIYEDEPEYSWL